FADLELLGGLAMLQTGSPSRGLTNAAVMANDHHPLEQTAFEFLVKRGAGLLTEVESDVSKGDAFGLIELLHAIDERTALQSDAAIVLDNAGIGFKDLRGHVELQADGIAGCPGAANREILAGSCAGKRLAIHGDLGAIGPARNSNVQGEFGGSRGSDGKVHGAVPWIVRFLLNFQTGAIFEMPIE